MANQRRSGGGFSMSGIIGILIVVAICYVLFKMVSGVYTLLSIAAPILFILAMFLNFSVVKDYGKMIIDKLKNDTPRGLLYAGGTFFLFPFVAAFLFVKAFMTKNLMKKQEANAKGKKQNEDYVKYEEVNEESEDFLELDDLEEDVKVEQPKEQNRYDDLFS